MGRLTFHPALIRGAALSTQVELIQNMLTGWSLTPSPAEKCHRTITDASNANLMQHCLHLYFKLCLAVVNILIDQ